MVVFIKQQGQNLRNNHKNCLTPYLNYRIKRKKNSAKNKTKQKSSTRKTTNELVGCKTIFFIQLFNKHVGLPQLRNFSKVKT